METINKIYTETIGLLKSNSRALPKYSEETIQKIIEEFNSISFEKLNDLKFDEKFNKLFCILTNTQTTSDKFHALLVKSFRLIMERKKSSKLLILFLGAVSKQVVDHSIKNGEKISSEFIQILKELLSSRDPEILEWSLRLIESLKSQSSAFKTEVLNLKPSLLKLFNKHQQNAFMIIDEINKEWDRLKNEKGR